MVDGEYVNPSNKLRTYFPGRVVRKDLTKKIKEGANVPVYVLEYLLGKYCTQEEDLIDEGVERVKDILAKNYVRPDEAEKVKSKIKEYGSYSIIDVVSVKLDYRSDRYVARFSNLGLKDVVIPDEYPKMYERLLGGNIWCMIRLEYSHGDETTSANPFKIVALNPIQVPHIDIEEVLSVREKFTKDEWIDVLLRSTGMEPTQLGPRTKWLLLLRLLPLVENNFNLCELGPRSTGKSHIYKEISPNSILVSGGQTTVANLFYNMSTQQVGLVGMWDCVAFDEVAGIKFKDKDGIAIMKDYMNSGSFSRGKEEKTANASMVFIGNINQSVSSLLKTSSLFAPFPYEMNTDTAFFDRIHCYLPGWEIPKFRPQHFTNDYGFITDYFAEFMREMRKRNYADAIDEYFRLGSDLNQRDVVAVKKMVSGLIKLVYPDGIYAKEDLQEILVLALESRRRVKEQLKKIGGMEFYDVNFSYIDISNNHEEYVGVAEQGTDKLIPEGKLKAGHLFTVGHAYESSKIGSYKLEIEMINGNGKFTSKGIGSKKEVKESVDIAFNYLQSNSSSVSGLISPGSHDYILQVLDLNGIGITKELGLASFIGLCSVSLNKSVLPSLAVLGNISIGGSINRIENLADTLQVCLDSGAKKVLLPMSASVDFGSVPAELLSKFTLLFYNDPIDAVKKALGVE